MGLIVVYASCDRSLCAHSMKFLFCCLDILIDELFFFLKLLEGIGAIKEADKKKNNYQDLVTTQLSREFDDDTVG